MTAEPLTPEQVEQWRSNPANDLLGPLFATLDAARAEVERLTSEVEALRKIIEDMRANWMPPPSGQPPSEYSTLALKKAVDAYRAQGGR